MLVTPHEVLAILASTSLVLAPGLARAAESHGGPQQAVDEAKQVGQGVAVEAVAPPAPARAGDRGYRGSVWPTHDPVVIEPLTATTDRARIGLSAWVAPGAPFDAREAPGGVAVGLTIAWPAARENAVPRHPRP